MRTAPIDQSTPLKLVGKNYAGYGEIPNENFVHLLENFSSAIAAAGPYLDKFGLIVPIKEIKVHDGTKFRTTGGAEVGTNPTQLV